jgi:hypothetical protein
MPRLDNGDELVLEEYNLVFNEADPGSTQPIDLCHDCYDYGWRGMNLDVDHPPYEDSKNLCYDCGKLLTCEDD